MCSGSHISGQTPAPLMANIPARLIAILGQPPGPLMSNLPARRIAILPEPESEPSLPGDNAIASVAAGSCRRPNATG